MKLQTTITVIDNVYHVQVGCTLSVSEQEAVTQFGEPIVEVGGTMSGSATRPGAGSATAVNFSLPGKQAYLPSDFPVKQVFSLDDQEDADVMAKIFQTTVESRMTAALTAARAAAANFAGETTTTVATA